jgi:hypothetical protein
MSYCAAGRGTSLNQRNQGISHRTIQRHRLITLEGIC